VKNHNLLAGSNQTGKRYTYLILLVELLLLLLLLLLSNVAMMQSASARRTHAAFYSHAITNLTQDNCQIRYFNQRINELSNE